MLWIAHVFIKYIIFNAHPKSFFMALNGLFQSLCCQHPKNELCSALLMLLCTCLSACFYVLLLIMKPNGCQGDGGGRTVPFDTYMLNHLFKATTPLIVHAAS